MKIPVSVVTGFLGAGKTTAINRFLKESGRAVNPERTAVIVNEVGQTGLDHLLFRQISDNIVLLDSGCLCCSVRGELVGALRDLFMAALHRKVAGLDRVVIETTGVADPAPVMYTLQYEPFLRERFEYDGSIAIVDAVNGASQLSTQEEAVQQVVFADVLALSKLDVASPEQATELRESLHELNPQAPLMSVYGDSLCTIIPRAREAHRLGHPGQLRPFDHRLSSSRKKHPGVHVLTVELHTRPSRVAFLRGLHALQRTPFATVLRIKGLVRFEGEEGSFIVQGVHQQLYPFESLHETPGSGETMFLVFILRAPDLHDFDKQLRRTLECV